MYVHLSPDLYAHIVAKLLPFTAVHAVESAKVSQAVPFQLQNADAPV